MLLTKIVCQSLKRRQEDQIDDEQNWCSRSFLEIYTNVYVIFVTNPLFLDVARERVSKNSL